MNDTKHTPTPADIQRPWQTDPYHWKDAKPSAKHTQHAEREPCEDCGRPIYWDEKRNDFRHITEPERGCFLIASESRTPQQDAELEIMRSRGEI